MKSQKNNSPREGQFPQRQRKGALVCLPRRGGIIGHKQQQQQQQLLPLQKHQRVFPSTAPLDDSTCGTKVMGRKRNICHPHQTYNYLFTVNMVTVRKRVASRNVVRMSRQPRLKTNPLAFSLQEDGAEIKRQVCQSCITQALVDVYIANMISPDNHWRRLQFHQAHDLCCKCSKRGKRQLSANIE